MRKITAALVVLCTILPFTTLAATFGPNVLTGGTATADNFYNDSATYNADKAFDGNDATFWLSKNTAFPHWLKYDLGSSTAKAGQLTLLRNDSPNNNTKDFSLQGSNNDSNWTSLTTSTLTQSGSAQTFNVFSDTSYRFFRLYITTSYDANSYSEINTMELRECTDCGGATTTTSTAASTPEQKYTLVATLVIAGLLGADFVRRLFAGKFGKKLPFA